MAEVELYTMPGCPYCARAREDLTARGVAFVEYNCGEDPEALERMKQLSGGTSVPVIVDENGVVTVGFGGACAY